MKRDNSQCIEQTFDLLVVGGGINGAAIAHMAARNGLKVCLVEKNDFASGTSSKSTKIVHGGLRYLENFEFSLVKEALKERTLQLKSAPHLIHSLGFLIPVYKTDDRPFWVIRLGIFFYDLLSGRYLLKKRRRLNVKEIEHFVPGIKTEDLIGGIMYYDGQMDDARIVIENILSAREHGAVVLNYTEVTSFVKEMGKAIGAEVVDKLTKNKFQVRAKKIIVAAGVWTDRFIEKEHTQAPQKIRPTKGIHVVYRGQVSDHALLLPAKSDNRVFFVIPWHGNSLIGTTDTDYSGDPDSIKVEEEDIQYLFNEAGTLFPQVEFKKEDIVTTFAGLRPLVFKEGSPSKVSRKHVVEESYSGVVYVYGGKYTTYRKIAEDALKKVTRKALIDTSESFPLYGSGEITQSAEDIVAASGLSAATVRHLISIYGARYQDVIKIAQEDEGLKEPVVSGFPSIKAQIIYSINVEMAQNDEDVLSRRLGLVYDDCQLDECRAEIKEYLKNL